MSKTVAQVVAESTKEVCFTLNEASKYSEWDTVGDKGLPFEFFDGETMILPPKEEIKIWGRTEKIGKKSYKLLYTAVTLSRQGTVEMPLSILRRMPSLAEEVELLKQDNPLGAPLLSKMPDIKRLEKLADMAGTNPILIREVALHRNGFDDNGKVIKDSADMDEKDRTPVLCHRFSLAA